MIIGPLPPPIGGATVLFQQLVNYLGKHSNAEPILINTSDGRKARKHITIMALTVLLKALKYLRHCDVVTFHASNRGAILFGPIIYAITKIHKKPFVLRLFGGSFDCAYNSLKPWQKKILNKTILSADVCFFETKKLITYFSELPSRNRKHNIVWFPNNKVPDNNISQGSKDKISRFVFISQVKKSKGIEEILSAANKVDDICIDIYGPLLDGITEKKINSYNVKYCGIIPPEQVTKILQDYDVLLLPTYYKGEGYPGIILEAYSVGVPVITTNWQAIPEIVDSNSGVLIEPKNVGQLIDAINKIKNNAFYEKLRYGAKEKARDFRSGYWTSKFVEACERVCANNKCR